MIIGISGHLQTGKNLLASIFQWLIAKQDKRNKDTVPEKFEDFLSHSANTKHYLSRWEQKAFATKLKQIVALIVGCTMEQLEDGKFKETPLGERWYIFDYVHNHFSPEQLTPRRLLQLMGTECGREILHPNIWVNALMVDYKHTRIVASNSVEDISRDPYPNWIVTDVRFINEAQAIKDAGGILVRIERTIEVKCNNCGWLGKESSLQKISHPGEDIDTNCCPYCDTDEYLIDVKPSTHPSETSLDNYKGFDYIIQNEGSIRSLITVAEEILHQIGILK